MDFIEDDQVKEGGRELLEDIAQRLESYCIQTLCAGIWIVPTMQAGAGFIGNEFLKTIFL